MTSLFDLAKLSVLEGHLIAASIKGALILITAAALCVALRRASAAVRHFVWSVTLTGLLALPLLSVGLPAWQIALLPASSIDPVSIAADSTEVTRSAPTTMATSRTTPQLIPSGDKPATSTADGFDHKTDVTTRETSPATAESLGWVRWAIAIWFAGALLIFGRLLIGTASIWWIAHRASRITDPGALKMTSNIAKQIGLTRRVEISTSPLITMPVTCGVIRSTILLPADADEWPDERRQVVLLHELAHVKRWDCLTQLLSQLACSIYWFNPLVWLASRQLRVERERACDDQVIDVGTKASDYASHLLEMARTFRSARCTSLATLAIARRSQLEGRLLAILDPGLKRRGLNRIAAIGVGVAIVCVVLPLATVRLSAMVHANKLPHAESTPAPRPEPASQGLVRLDSPGVQAAQHRAEQTAQPASDETHTPLPEESQRDQEGTNVPGPPQQKDNSAMIQALREALKDEDSEVRQHALFALTQIGDQPALAALMEALKDQSWQVRANAAYGLGLRGGRNNVDALVGALRDANWQVREQAAWGLGLRGDARAIEPLMGALRDESSEVREKAAWALGLKGDKRAVEPLMAALKDASAKVRGMAAWALGLKSDSRAGDALKDALKDPDKGVRQNAAWALGMLLMKRGGAPVGLPDPDGDVDRGIESDREGVPGGVAGGVPSGVAGGVPGGVRGGIPGGALGGVPGGVGGGIPGGVPGGVSNSRLIKLPGAGPWSADGIGRGVGGGVGAGAGDKNKIMRPKSSAKTKSKAKQN